MMLVAVSSSALPIVAGADANQRRPDWLTGKLFRLIVEARAPAGTDAPSGGARVQPTLSGSPFAAEPRNGSWSISSGARDNIRKQMK